MRIGLISDIHGKLRKEAAAALEGCDRILCMGDVERQDVLIALGNIAPTITVEGNCDCWGTIFDNLPPHASVTLEGVSIYMTHIPEMIPHPRPDVDVILHGHTHIPRDQEIGGIRYINPGSPSRPRGNSKPSVAIMTVSEGSVQSVEFIELEN